MNLIIRILLATDSIMLLLIIYYIKAKIWYPFFGAWSTLIYLLLPLILAILCLCVAEKLSKDSIEGGITEIELANDSNLPSYLGFFFVAVSIPDGDWLTLVVVIYIILVFLILSQNLFYNPLFLLLRYQFYHIRSNESKILVISKKRMKTASSVTFQNLRRINDYTFLDVEDGT